MSIDEDTPLIKGSNIGDNGNATSINVTVQDEAPTKPPPRKRMLSLDTARGLTIFGMVLVDNQGGSEVIWPLKETVWNGISTADLIFPSFLFICGFSISLALKNAKNDKATWINIIRRTILLFSIQLFLNAMAHKFHSSFRVMGVLQRISLCYFFSCCSFMLLPKWAQRVGLMISATIYLCLMYAYPVPGCGRGVITPNCNAAGYIDNLILGKNMMHPTDPEGFITTSSAYITTWMGVELGRILTTHARSADGYKDILIRWLAIGMVCALGATFMDATGLIYFNKIIWSFSFALLTVACGAIFISALYYAMDIHQWSERVRRYIELAAQPFIWIGTNPITIYTLMIFIEIILMFYLHADGTTLWTACYEKMYLSWLRNGYLASTVFSIMWFVFFDAIAYLMFRNNIIIKL